MDDGRSVSRRGALRLGASAALAGLFAPVLARRAEAQALRGGQILPAPNFNLQPADYTIVARNRPARTGGIKIGPDAVLTREINKYVIHNYGHGGAGITLSFGCAMQVKTHVADYIAALPHGARLPRAAVLGSGIIGLTVAKELRDAWPAMAIRVLTKSRSIQQTASIIAGGQFAPSGVFGEYQRTHKESTLLDLVTASKAHIKSYFADGSYIKYGIRERYNYSLTEVPELKFCGPSLIPVNKGLLPFQNLRTVEGYEYSTYLIEPAIIMPELVKELNRKKVPIAWSTPVASKAAMARLPEDIIINCTGLDAGDLVADQAVYPIKGQLVVLKKNSQKLKYFVSGGCAGQTFYMFARSSDIVVGGTYETCVPHPAPEPDAADCARILKRAQSVFDGKPEDCLLYPSPCS